jgi:hypothetical protein
VWPKFASTSSEVYKLLKKFDSAYTILHEKGGDKWAQYKKTIKKLNKAWKEGLDPAEPDLDLAGKYKAWLPDYLEQVVKKAEESMLANFALVAKVGAVEGLLYDRKLFTAELEKKMEAEIKNYS